MIGQTCLQPPDKQFNLPWRNSAPSSVVDNLPYLPSDNRDSAIAQAKFNCNNAYAVLNEIHDHAADIQESELDLMAGIKGSQGTEYYQRKILKAMLKCKQPQGHAQMQTVERYLLPPMLATSLAAKSSKPSTKYGLLTLFILRKWYVWWQTIKGFPSWPLRMRIKSCLNHIMVSRR